MSDTEMTKRELAWLQQIRRVSFESGYLAAKLATIGVIANLKPPPIPPDSVEESEAPKP